MRVGRAAVGGNAGAHHHASDQVLDVDVEKPIVVAGRQVVRVGAEGDIAPIARSSGLLGEAAGGDLHAGGADRHPQRRQVAAEFDHGVAAVVDQVKIGAGATLHLVGAGAAIERIGAVTADQQIGRAIAGDAVGQRIADRRGRQVAGQGQGFNVCRQGMADAGEHAVVAGAG